jgi:sec-independent protein translocase protein TatB
MFDITSSKLLILGIVALLVIGPKDLPALLRTVGKYMGIIRRQAAEFRAQFDEAMRESELQELKKSVESIQQETAATIRKAEAGVERQLADARQSVDAAMAEPKSASDGTDTSASTSIEGAPSELNGSTHSADTSVPSAIAVPGEAVDTLPTAAPSEPARTTEKSGA